MKSEQLRKLIKLIINESYNIEKIDETISPKNQAIIDKWVKELGLRMAGKRMIDSILKQKVGGLTSEDLPDTTIFADGLDEIESMLESGDYELALRTAHDTVREMLEEEGGEGLFEGFSKNFTGSEEKIYKEREGGRDVYWMDNKDTGGKIYINPDNIKKYISKGYRIIDTTMYEGDEADAVNDMWAGSDDEMDDDSIHSKNPIKYGHNPKGAYGLPSPKQKGGLSGNQRRKLRRSQPQKDVRDMDWPRIKKSIDKGTLGENEETSNYRVDYAVLGLEGIDPTFHATGQEASKAAYDFIKSYNTEKSKRAGERMIVSKDPPGVFIRHIGGGTVAAAVIRNLKKQKMSENIGGQNPLDGKSNVSAASFVNKILAESSKGIFSDNSWEAINKIFQKLKESGLEVSVLSAKYGGQGDTSNGMPKYKEWQISIPFTNNKGKPAQLVGQITAHGAGSVEQPLDRYDISAYVNAINIR